MYIKDKKLNTIALEYKDELKRVKEFLELDQNQRALAISDADNKQHRIEELEHSIQQLSSWVDQLTTEQFNMKKELAEKDKTQKKDKKGL